VNAQRLRTSRDAEIGVALAEALAGGPPVAPLPDDAVERDRALAMLQPEVPVAEDDAAAIVSTSGSTGQPKGVVLSRAAIRASVAATHDRLGGPGDWVLALPPHYVAGLMVLARGLVAGTTVATARPDLTDLPAVASTLTERRYLSVVPTQLARAARQPDLVAALASFVAVLVGGAPADPTLLDHLRSVGVPLVTTYGMSETCGGVVYDGRPLRGVDVRVGDGGVGDGGVDDGGVDDGGGRITLGGGTLFSGYRLRPDLTAAALVDGRLLTQDRGRWRGDRLEVLGRLDDVVISGGLNVDLAEVERLARPWCAPRGHDLAVLGLPDAEWGTAVVAVTDADGTLADLQDFLSDFVPTYAVPRELVRLEALPRTSSGKIDRQSLRSLIKRSRLTKVPE
jgi:O-succinylbenzoic acid--CoA ligase